MIHGEGLVGEDTFCVPPKSTKPFELMFIPIKV